MKLISYKNLVSRKAHVCDYCLCTIPKGIVYTSSFLKTDDVYTWKNHIHCGEIAEKLKMFDECDEGLTDEVFRETIREQYTELMERHNSEVFNYEFFQYPDFEDQLKFVLKMHEIPMNKLIKK